VKKRKGKGRETTEKRGEDEGKGTITVNERLKKRRGKERNAREGKGNVSNGIYYAGQMHFLCRRIIKSTSS